MQCKSQISDYNIAYMPFGDIAVFFFSGGYPFGFLRKKCVHENGVEVWVFDSIN
jgi:hypothetical protein